MKNDLLSCERNLCICVRGLKKNSGLNVVSTRDPMIPGRCSSQLSYDAIDVGSWSIMCSYVPVKEMSVTDVYEINHITSAEVKAEKNDPRSCERNLCNCIRSLKKNQDFNGS